MKVGTTAVGVGASLLGVVDFAAQPVSPRAMSAGAKQRTNIDFIMIIFQGRTNRTTQVIPLPTAHSLQNGYYRPWYNRHLIVIVLPFAGSYQCRITEYFCLVRKFARLGKRSAFHRRPWHMNQAWIERTLARSSEGKKTSP